MDQEFRLLRGASNTDNSLIVEDGAIKCDLNFKDVYIRVPTITLPDQADSELTRDILQDKNNQIEFFHRKFTAVKIPKGETKFLYDMAATDSHAFIAEQIKRDGDIKKYFSKFDNLQPNDEHVIIGDTPYPKQYISDTAKFYIDFKNFRRSYYGKEPTGGVIKKFRYFKDYFIRVYDLTCAHSQPIKSLIDPIVDSTYSTPIPEGATMYIVSLIKRSFTYFPLTKKGYHQAVNLSASARLPICR